LTVNLQQVKMTEERNIDRECINCGRPFKISKKEFRWRWYCNECYRQIKIEKNKNKKPAEGGTKAFNDWINKRGKWKKK